ncbi:MAG TPA: MaoC/PaaZ C-terminal domain-containing protein [Streptosporangiaceae bacterium]
MSEQEQDYTGPLDPLDFTISDQVQGQCLEALEDYHPRYVLGRRGAAPLTHPGILLSQSNVTRSPSFTGPNTRWIHLRERTRFTAPARLGDKLTVRWVVEEHEPWFGRRLTRVSCAVTRDESGILHRLMWGLRASAERPVPGRDERPDGPAPGSSAARSSGPAPGRRRPGAAPGPALRASPDLAGWEIPGRRKHVTSDRIQLFSGRVAHTLHTDEQVAKQAGLPAPVASATQGMGYLCEFMIDNFGEGWLSGGSWELTFRKPVFPDDWLCASGRITATRQAGEGVSCSADVRLANDRDVTVTSGIATVAY